MRQIDIKHVRCDIIGPLEHRYGCIAYHLGPRLKLHRIGINRLFMISVGYKYCTLDGLVCITKHLGAY